MNPTQSSQAAPTRSLAFVDLKTTGIGSTDRIVCLGAVKLPLAAQGEITVLHLVFDPGCETLREAARPHGYTAEELARQDPFEAYAGPLRRWFEGVDLLVANSALELQFLREALARPGAPDLATPGEGLTRRSRLRGEAPVSLDAVAARLGLTRSPRHGALRDAWLCMHAFLWLHGLPMRLNESDCGDPAPANFRLPGAQLQRVRSALAQRAIADIRAGRKV